MKAIRPLLCVVALLAARPAAASIMVSEGNQPVQDFGWPAGALEVANLETRIGYWEGPPFGGGEFHFLYRGDNESANVAVKAFAAIHAEKLEIIVHDGLGHDQFLAKDAPVDWSFTVWVPTNWDNLYNNPKVTFNTNDPNYGKPLPPPRMHVYVGAGGLDWNKISVPLNLTVRDERVSNVSHSAGIDTRRVEQCLKDFESITNGMTRAEVEKKLTMDGGLHGIWKVRYVHPECFYFKIDVQYESSSTGTDQQPPHEGKRDKVIQVSKPYLERPFSD